MAIFTAVKDAEKTAEDVLPLERQNVATADHRDCLAA
jgi:hypothetical protein